ncbi:reverse transcriptase domain-containing protein [Tanacetum coccineum]
MTHLEIGIKSQENGTKEKNHEGITSHNNHHHHHTVTNAQLKALIDQGVADALAARDADRSMNSDDIHNSGTGVRRQAPLAREMFPKESDKIKKYVGGLPDMIHGSVMASKPKTMQDAIEFATELMDKKINTFAKPYTAGSDERKEYARTLPLCNKCKFHNGQCTVKYVNCKRVGHLTRDCRSPAASNNQKNLTCYECGNQGHYKSDCLKLKNRNHENQAEGTEARGMVYALGEGETDQDPNNIEDEIKT